MAQENPSHGTSRNPAPAARAGASPAAVPQAPVTRPERIRIYLVDDHALVRKGLVTVLGEEPDMEVCGEAEDAATAIADIMRLRPAVVVVDISLKGNSGIELIKGIKAYDPHIAVVVVSMHDESVYALRALRAGARAYLMKEQGAERIAEAIRRVLNGQIYVSDRVAGQMLDSVIGGKESSASEFPVSGLSDRELEVVNLIGEGMLTREIATKLHLSIKTVETHRAHIKEKLNLPTALRLVQFCVLWVEEKKRTQEH